CVAVTVLDHVLFGEHRMIEMRRKRLYDFSTRQVIRTIPQVFDIQLHHVTRALPLLKRVSNPQCCPNSQPPARLQNAAEWNKDMRFDGLQFCRKNVKADCSRLHDAFDFRKSPAMIFYVLHDLIRKDEIKEFIWEGQRAVSGMYPAQAVCLDGQIDITT